MTIRNVSSNLVDTSVLEAEIESLQSQLSNTATTVSGLQNQINAKANSLDIANTVSGLQQTDTNLQGQIANKSEVGHTHLPADITGLSQSLSLQWTRRNANSEMVLKTLVDTSNGDLILSVPTNVTNNQEFEIKKIFASNYCRITGISKINGYSVNLNDLLFFDDALTQASTTKLIFIDSTIGWLSFPSSAFSKIQPLSLPTNKLKQLFYSGNISGIANGGTIQTWIDTISNLNASGGSATRPTLQTSIFGNNTIPGVLFNGSQWFQANLGWSNEGYITGCVVERRNSGATGLCCIGIGTTGANGFEMSYGTSGTTFYGRSRNITTAFTVPAYDASNPLTRIWTFSVNSRENSLWMNGNKVIVSTSNKPINSDNTYIGANAGFRYSGWMPLLALYSGDITDTEIKAISDAANQTFKVY
ncbi:hypothetical protein [Scytonema sp. NUACC26]|uniref:hypothetical protein n=1 Tax=Scytonema sp. NUACC26 TaxID=3140176 RepID=UPI0034DC789E